MDEKRVRKIAKEESGAMSLGIPLVLLIVYLAVAASFIFINVTNRIGERLDRIEQHLGIPAENPPIEPSQPLED